MSKKSVQKTLARLAALLEEEDTSTIRDVKRKRNPPSTLNVLSRRVQNQIKALERGIRVAEETATVQESIPGMYRDALSSQLHFLENLRQQYVPTSRSRSEQQLAVTDGSITRDIDFDSSAKGVVPFDHSPLRHPNTSDASETSTSSSHERANPGTTQKSIEGDVSRILDERSYDQLLVPSAPIKRINELGDERAQLPKYAHSGGEHTSYLAGSECFAFK